MTQRELSSLISIATRTAARDRSDPFLRDRIIAHHLSGVKLLSDYGEEYRANAAE